MSTEKRALARAIELAGGQSELARRLTELTGEPVSQSTVSMWMTAYDGRCSPSLARYIELITGVSASDLRPDYYGEIAL